MIRKLINNSLTYAVTLLVVLIIAVPFLYMLTSSFKTDIEISRNALSLIPHSPNLKAFQTLFERIPFWSMFLNSVFVALVSSVLAMLICSLVSYGFVRFEFKGKNLVFTLILVTMMIPNQVFLIPQFRMYQFLGAYNTFFPADPALHIHWIRRIPRPPGHVRHPERAAGERNGRRLLGNPDLCPDRGAPLGDRHRHHGVS